VSPSAETGVLLEHLFRRQAGRMVAGRTSEIGVPSTFRAFVPAIPFALADDLTVRPVPGVPDRFRVEDHDGNRIGEIVPVPGTPYRRLEDRDGRAIGEILA